MILGIILLSIALLVCLYPVISNFTAVKYQSIVQTRYEKAVSNMDDTELQKAKEAASVLGKASGFIRHELMNRLELRKVPELHFIADDSIEHSADIQRILREIGAE